MIPWRDAIDKLRFHCYSVTLIEGKLRYTYQGKGNPPQDEITPLLEVLKAHKAEFLKDPCFLIEQTIQAINEGWEPGTLEWMKANRPDDWCNMLTLEGRVNEKALGGNIEGLREALNEYQSLILAAVKAYKALKENKGQEMFNFVEHPKIPRDGVTRDRMKEEAE